MPQIITTVHDPRALAATCRRLGLEQPTTGEIELDGLAAWGQIVRLPGLYAPIVCDTLSGLISYHPRDGAFLPYARIMRFVYRYYAIRAALLRDSNGAVIREPWRPKSQRMSAVAAVA
jgi:hypothetical protein